MKRFNPLKPAAPSAQPMVAQRTAPQPPGATEFPVTLSENHQRNGLELRFPRNPGKDICADLHNHGWRWSRFKMCWYHRNTPENRSYATRYLKADGVPVPVAPITPPPVSIPAAANEEPKMETPLATASAAGPETNILRVDFQPETAFPVPPKPVPAWKRALLRRP